MPASVADRFRIVTFYNHKGGVSKTTTAFNLGAFLASRMEKKVLFVDADPQSNLTEYFFSPPDDDSEFEIPGTSIVEALRPRFEGAASRVDVSRLKLPEHKEYKNLYILRGDWAFSLAERYFSNSIAFAITESVHEKNTYVVLHNMLRDLLEKRGFDHILVDLGPSSGAITNLALLSCDGYFIPVTPDRFCTQAVEALARLVRDWIERHSRTVATFAPYGIEASFGSPVFLGAVSQNFKAYAGRTTRPYEHWGNQILSIIQRDLVPHVPSLGDGKSYVATIKDFGGLAPVAHIVGKAIFDLDKGDTEYASARGIAWSGVALASWLDRASAYGREIEKLAKVLSNA